MFLLVVMKILTKLKATEYDGFYVIGQFDNDSGLGEGSVSYWLGPIEVLRLYVETTEASWIIFSEVSCSTYLPLNGLHVAIS